MRVAATATAAVLFALAMLAAPPALARARCAGGSVYLDRNGDGRRDNAEPGLPGMRVSNGESIVETDPRGRYRLDRADGRSLFLIKPAGYAVSRRPDGLPDSWRDPATGTGCRDFGLQARAPPPPAAPFEVLLFGDPQPKSGVDVGYYQADIVAPLRVPAGAKIADLALSLGDLVDDVPALFPALKRVDASLALPWLHAPGNHDVDPDERDDAASLDAFHAAFGPDTYAWEEERANFLVLDDVIVLPPGGRLYIGGLRPGQFAFLEAYLAKADPARLLVLALHIPLFDVGGAETFRHADRARLFALLARFPQVLVLSAHTHGQQHVYYGAADGWTGAAPLHEYNVGAACGGYWSGVKDAQGIPASTMADGTPNGYARLRIDAGGGVALRWFAARQPEQAQIGLHAPKAMRRGAWPGVGVYANVWMGQADTQVEYRIDGGDWKPMQRLLQADPAILAENLRDDDASVLRGYDRTPEAVPSTHLWRGALPTSLAPGRHDIEVRAPLAGYGLAVASTSYELLEAPP